jgi:hypothetical protein
MNGYRSQSPRVPSLPRRARLIRQSQRAFALVALLLTAVLTGGFSGASGAPIAKEARVLTVHETAHLHRVSHHNEVIVEEGHGSGTLNGKLVIHLTLAYTQGTVTFTAYPPGGTVIGRGEGSSYVNGSTAYFTGKASVTGGTGKYAHASAINVPLRGTLQRQTFAFFVEFTAKLHY